MKVKRFKNLWTMGLILTGAILFLFYVAKIFFPEFIIGVAEIPSIVKFGNYVDSHKWAYYVFDSVISIVFTYFYFCACSRKRTLSIKGILIAVLCVLILKLVSTFASTHYTTVNYALFAFSPFLVCCLENNLSKGTFISASVCFFVDIMAQLLSLIIRDVVILANHLNSATFFILLIDTFIWRILLYFYFNNNKKEKEV